jgi:acetyl-CoA carboxylase/biotin carboxylase 1
MIVDALREHSHPVYIYLPPHGELRGGSWVVVDPTINSEKMEMYADPDSRGGILEPAGITEVKFRLPDQLKVMHRIDPELQLLDSEMEMTDMSDETSIDAIKEQISSREDLLKPVYLQAATEFADLHDKTGRMKAKGVIRAAVPWARSREYFFYRAKRRIHVDDFVAKLKAADDSMDTAAAMEIVQATCTADFEDDQAVTEFFANNADTVDAKIKSVKASAFETKIASLKAELDAM